VKQWIGEADNIEAKDWGWGLKIGNINVNNTGCADDIALLSTQLSDAQIMVNMALDFANLEGYELQPKKSSLLHLGHGDIPHIKFLVCCFALFVVSSNVDCYTFLWL
jgi:hypothetical protein